MAEIKHVVFDIGRVLLHWDAELIYTDLIPNRDERIAFLNEVCTPEWNLEQDRGRSWETAESVLIERHPQHSELITAFRKNWHLSIPHSIDGSPEIVLSLLEQGADVTLLTNFNQETYLEAEEKFPFLKQPRGVTVSGRVGLLKPDLAIYDHHIQTFGLEPKKTIFFDDSQKNVDGAIAAGWNAHLFTDSSRMKRDLVGHGFKL